MFVRKSSLLKQEWDLIECSMDEKMEDTNVNMILREYLSLQLWGLAASFFWSLTGLQFYAFICGEMRSESSLGIWLVEFYKEK